MPAGPQLYANAPRAARPAPPRRTPVPPGRAGGRRRPLDPPPLLLSCPAACPGPPGGCPGERRPPRPPARRPLCRGSRSFMLMTRTKARAGGPRSLACRPRAPRPPQRARRGAGRALPARAPGLAAAPLPPPPPPSPGPATCGAAPRPPARSPAPPRTKGCGSGAAARGSARHGCTCRILGGFGRLCLGTERGERGPFACSLSHLVPDVQRFGLKPSAAVAVPACTGNRA